jgi:hypothetical protein
METPAIEIMSEDVHFLPGAKAIVTTEKGDAGKDVTVVTQEYDSQPWSYWGDDNLFPQNVQKDLELNSIALRALEKRKNVHYGRGIIAYRNAVDEVTGEEKKTKVTDQEVLEFFRINRVNLQWIDLIGSLEIFANGFVEFITNKAGNKINRVFIKDPTYCRWERMDETTARIKNLYYSAIWDKAPSTENRTLAKIACFDPYRIKDDGTYPDKTFIYPVFYKSFNKSYYHLAVWNGVRSGGWMDIANKVPKLKLAIMHNQMTIKYHVEIPNDYFSKRFPSGDFTVAMREQKRKEKEEELNKFLTDVENSGKSLVTYHFYDQVMKTTFPGWKINVIDNKLKDDAYLPDSQAANSEILFAIGVDPSLIGGSGVPGGKLGAGSGSDKREAFWMLNAEMGPYRQISLDPLYFVRDFNGWDPTIEFDYVTVDTSQTQDKHPTKTEKRIDNTQS